ncbi:MAG: SMC-Scp complex subunit ScpB [Candidatus Omnitrophota bacterium]
MQNVDKIKNIIEALLIISEDGLSAEDFKKAVPDSDISDIEEGIHLLKNEYALPARAFNLAEIAGKYRIVTKPEYMPWIDNLYQKEKDRLTLPALETLAIIAYNQSITRAEIENVRGVNSGGVIKTILEKELIEIKGRRDIAGRPLMYGVTEKFLKIFGLNSLSDLPSLKDFKEDELEFVAGG